jgi:hypothetical protein
MLNLTVTGNDGGITTHVVLTRHEQHQTPGTLHPVTSQRLGRQTESTPRLRRLEARPELLFEELDERFGRDSIDRLASALKTLLPRYNAG